MSFVAIPGLVTAEPTDATPKAAEVQLSLIHISEPTRP